MLCSLISKYYSITASFIRLAVGRMRCSEEYCQFVRITEAHRGIVCCWMDLRHFHYWLGRIMIQQAGPSSAKSPPQNQSSKEADNCPASFQRLVTDTFRMWDTYISRSSCRRNAKLLLYYYYYYYYYTSFRKLVVYLTMFGSAKIVQPWMEYEGDDRDMGRRPWSIWRHYLDTNLEGLKRIMKNKFTLQTLLQLFR